jgi:hypothetical protein
MQKWRLQNISYPLEQMNKLKVLNKTKENKNKTRTNTNKTNNLVNGKKPIEVFLLLWKKIFTPGFESSRERNMRQYSPFLKWVVERNAKDPKLFGEQISVEISRAMNQFKDFEYSEKKIQQESKITTAERKQKQQTEQQLKEKQKENKDCSVM